MGADLYYERQHQEVVRSFELGLSERITRYHEVITACGSLLRVIWGRAHKDDHWYHGDKIEGATIELTASEMRQVYDTLLMADTHIR